MKNKLNKMSEDECMIEFHKFSLVVYFNRVISDLKLNENPKTRDLKIQMNMLFDDNLFEV